MLLENHLFYLLSTLTERLNTLGDDVDPSEITNDDASDFVVSTGASHDELISFPDIRFICDLVVTKPDGTILTTPLAMSEAAATINNILQSLFHFVTVQMGGKVISDTSSMYHIRAYFEYLLGYTPQAQPSQLTCARWQRDTDINFGLLTNKKMYFRNQSTLNLLEVLYATPGVATLIQLSG